MTDISDIFIVAVVDRSGSMAPIWETTVTAFDAFIADQAKLGRGWVSLTYFDDQIDISHRAWGLADLPKFASLDVKPRGATAMYDAIGRSIVDADKWLVDNPWFGDGTRMCVIQTDGHENASQTWDQSDIFKLIREHEAKGWTFVYLGANQDAWDVARMMGITTHDTVMDYKPTPIATAGAYAGVTHSIGNLRSGKGFTPLTGDDTKDG